MVLLGKRLRKRAVAVGIALWLTGSVAPLVADDPAIAPPAVRTSPAIDRPESTLAKVPERSASLAERVAEIQAQKQAAEVSARANIHRLEAVWQQARRDLTSLVTEIEAGDQSKLTIEEHALLARIYSTNLSRFDDAARHAQLVVDARPKDAAAWKMLVWTQAWQPKTLAAAEASFAKAIEVLPRHYHEPLHTNLALGFMRAKRHGEAADHLSLALELIRGWLLNDVSAPHSYLQRVEQVVANYQLGQQSDAALRFLDREAAEVTANGRLAEIASLVAAELTSQKIELLFQIGQQAQAQSLLTESLRSASAAYAADPENPALLQSLVPLARIDWELAAKQMPLEHPDYVAKRATYLQLLGQLVRHEGVRIGVRRFCAQPALLAGSELLAEGRLEEAESVAVLLSEAVLFETDGHIQWQGRLGQFDSSVRTFVRQVTTEPTRLALVGQPAFPLEVDAWINGSPLTDDDLRGKVVLRHFGAMSSDSYLSRLRAWHDKYADRGLVIIGLTNYYNYRWDAAAGKAVNSTAQTRRDEQATLRHFAQHHLLNYRLALLKPGSELWRQYRPAFGLDHQFVLIDRAGKVRMIRLAKDDQNAKAIETLIEPLLDESPP